MTINDKIRYEDLQYNANREAAKLAAYWSNKIGKYQYLTSEQLLPSNQSIIIDQAKCTCTPLGEAFENQKNMIKDKEKNK